MWVNVYFLNKQIQIKSLKKLNNCSFILIDLLGKIQKNTALPTNNEIINLNNINDGIYLYYIRNSNNIVKKGKIIIKDN